MFGFVVPNMKDLSEEGTRQYKAFYCGLCRSLGEKYGIFSRMTLTYDMTFLNIVLSSVDENDSVSESEARCPVHVLKKRPFFVSSHTEYATDMNILFSYFSLIDKVRDRQGVLSSAEAALLKKSYQQAAEKRSSLVLLIEEELNALDEIEKAGEINPDIPANLFGNILGQVFAGEKNDPDSTLEKFGNALGRFVYLADAVVDFKSDLKHERYNPLVFTRKESFEDMLKLLLSECTQAYEALPVKRYSEIIENILYSGVWAIYGQRREKQKNEESV